MFLVLAVIAASAAGAVVAARMTVPTPLPIGAPGPWKLVFSDGFSGTKLDTSKWSTGWFGRGVTRPLATEDPYCFDPREVSVGRGVLHLSVAVRQATCGGTTHPYVAGIVTTNGKFSYTYGFAQIRARFAINSAGQAYDWPIFWTNGQIWPTDGEDDIVEGIGGELCWHFHSPLGGPGGCQQTPVTPGWHTYGADWEPGSVTYYYDGHVVGTVTAGITNAPMYLILSIGVNRASAGPIRAATFRIASVHVWQHG